MSYWYFLSYARDDKSETLIRFHQDLSEQIRLQPNLPAVDRAGFFDGEAIRIGDPWKPDLAEALCTSRVFVCLFSPAYFNGHYCGKEFQVFLERQESIPQPEKRDRHAGGASPRLIFPIFWGRPSGDFPLQYTDDELPALYAKEGLQYLMSLTSRADDYRQFVRVLATRLVSGGLTWPLGELKNLRPLDEVPSAFRNPQTVAGASRNTMRVSGRHAAKFIFVAARSEELHRVKSCVDGYAGGGDWQPYLPDDEDPVFLIAQEAATKLKLYFHEIALTENLEEDLRQAERGHEIVMIIADPWTLELPRYKELIRSYDRVTSLNCALLVPVNEAEPETIEHRDRLRQILKDVFQYKTRVNQGIYYQDAIPNAGAFKAGLLNTMSQIRLDIINSKSASAGAAVQNDALRDGARELGISNLDQTPTVPVPTPEGSP